MSSKNHQQFSSVPHSRINALVFIERFIQENEIKNKVVVDVSAGSGFVAGLWHDAGAKVEAFDKFPEIFKHDSLKCSEIELNAKLPIASNHADYVLLMETIEHIPDQLQLLKELSRILKPNGKLIITKPNNSNFSGRIANLWLESERSNLFLPNEKTVIGYDNNKTYLGRIFLIGVQKLRTLAAISDLQILKIYPNQISVSSVLWGILFGLFYWIRTNLTYLKLAKKANSEEKIALGKQLWLNNHPSVLFHKHLCMVFEKKSFQ
jgi:SAM-dependent methyltransferase